MLCFLLFFFSRAAADLEVDAQVEANLATECSLIVLDTLENLVMVSGDDDTHM